MWQIKFKSYSSKFEFKIPVWSPDVFCLIRAYGSTHCIHTKISLFAHWKGLETVTKLVALSTSRASRSLSLTAISRWKEPRTPWRTWLSPVLGRKCPRGAWQMLSYEKARELSENTGLGWNMQTWTQTCPCLFLCLYACVYMHTCWPWAHCVLTPEFILVFLRPIVDWIMSKEFRRQLGEVLPGPFEQQ